MACKYGKDTCSYVGTNSCDTCILLNDNNQTEIKESITLQDIRDYMSNLTIDESIAVLEDMCYLVSNRLNMEFETQDIEKMITNMLNYSDVSVEDKYLYLIRDNIAKRERKNEGGV